MSKPNHYCLFKGGIYYGVIDVLGAPTVLASKYLSCANFYPENLVPRLVELLKREGIAGVIPRPVEQERERVTKMGYGPALSDRERGGIFINQRNGYAIHP